MPMPMGMGMPPMGLGGPPGMGPMPGMGQPQGGPDPAMAALQGLSGMPAPQREEKALAEASANIQLALAGVYSRSAKASRHLSNAYSEIQQAREALNDIAAEGVGMPPDLGGSLMPQSQGMATPMM